MVSQASPACLPAFVKSRGRRKTKLYQQEDDCTRWTVVHFSMHSDGKNMILQILLTTVNNKLCDLAKTHYKTIKSTHPQIEINNR